MEVNALKVEIKHLQTSNIAINAEIKKINGKLQKDRGVIISEPTPVSPGTSQEPSNPDYLMLMNSVTFQKWYIRITFMIKPDFIIKNAIALVDSGADMNCI